MASISSLMSSSSSSTSSIFGNRSNNMITGLASGLDTESLIEGMVQGYKQKIVQLQQSKTKVQWQQEAYQSISDKLVEFSRKYTSYSYSTTNLMSSSFFNNSVITTAKGDYADKITAIGKSSSEIVINGVKNLATTAKATSSPTVSGVQIDGDSMKVSATEALDFDKDVNVSNLEGTLTLTYGSQKVTISFSEQEFFDENGTGDGTISADKLKDAIVEKLGDKTIKTSSGSVAADELIDVTVENGQIKFSDAASSNAIYISGVTGKLEKTLGLEDTELDEDANVTSITVGTNTPAASQVNRAEYLSDQKISVTYNGVTKTIALKDVLKPDGTETAITDYKTFAQNLNKELSDAFGANKVTVNENSGKLEFTVSSDSTLSVQSDVDSVMGFDGGMTSYLNTGKTLKELGSFDADTGKLSLGGVELQGTKSDSTGEDGEQIYEYTLTINGETLTFDQNTTIDKIVSTINSSDAGVQVSYSKLTNQFNLVSNETGAASKIETGKDDLGTALFGQINEHGKDAEFTATINGKTTTYTRSSNTVELDGLTVTLEGTFEPTYVTNEDGTVTSEIDQDAGVTFTTKTDSDKIVDAIKQMVTDFNTMITEIKKAYTDMPLEKSDGSAYEPLTAEDEADLSESEIAAYEEKAKTGILFMDTELSGLYSALRGVAVSGADTGYLSSIGITTNYEDGITTLSVDETKLRAALESDLDGVRDAFVSNKDNGASSDGLMASMQEVIDRYAATTGATKGILIEKAGSKYSTSASLDNTMLDKMNDLDEQIAKWQDKMSNKVDYYTNKFTQLEVLINQMNSQSSALAGLTGSY